MLGEVILPDGFVCRPGGLFRAMSSDILATELSLALRCLKESFSPEFRQNNARYAGKVIAEYKRRYAYRPWERQPSFATEKGVPC